MSKKASQVALILLTITALLLPTRAAQAQNNLFLFIEQVDASAFPKISMTLSAWTAAGKPVNNLQPEDFIVQERANMAFHPMRVTVDDNAPLAVALALDISTSMAGQPLIDAKTAAARFLDRLSPADQAALVAFSGGVSTDPAELNPAHEMSLTGDLASLYALVETLQIEGNTALYNAAVKAVRMVNASTAGHRAVLILSDGRNDPPGEGDPEEAIRLAKEARIPIFVIGLGSEVDGDYLRRLAAETGGLYRAAPRSSELADLFGDMAELLKTRYTLEFISKVTDGGTGELGLTVSAKGMMATDSVLVGPLPALPTATSTASPVPPTKTPLPPTATAAPSATPTAAPSATSIPTAVKSAETQPPSTPWELIGLGGGILIIGAGTAAGVMISRRKPKPAPEQCAYCGSDLTGVTGACPVCKRTGRVPRK